VTIRSRTHSLSLELVLGSIPTVPYQHNLSVSAAVVEVSEGSIVQSSGKANTKEILRKAMMKRRIYLIQRIGLERKARDNSNDSISKSDSDDSDTTIGEGLPGFFHLLFIALCEKELIRDIESGSDDDDRKCDLEEERLSKSQYFDESPSCRSDERIICYYPRTESCCEDLRRKSEEEKGKKFFHKKEIHYIRSCPIISTILYASPAKMTPTIEYIMI
jgi:hypothetical protein